MLTARHPLTAASSHTACNSCCTAHWRPSVTRRSQHNQQQHLQAYRSQPEHVTDTPVSSTATPTISTSIIQDGALGPSTSGRSVNNDAQSLLTFEEIQQIAAARGLHITLKMLGPAYRIVCRDGGTKGPIVGVTAGFVAPLFGLMHCDMLQIVSRGLKPGARERIRRNALGLGLLLGGAVFAYGWSCGCRKAEILAINDDDAWHARLVRYYSYFGFKPVCRVGGRAFFKDLPHLLVWGGEGTRMDADIQQTLARWTPAIRQGSHR